MKEVETQSRIIADLRQVIGGPGSLRWASHLLVPALCGVAAAMFVATGREADEIGLFLDLGDGLATPVMRAAFHRKEPEPAPLAAIEKVKSIQAAIVFGLTQPASYARPSHLVLGAVMAVLGQIADLRGTPHQQIVDLIKAETLTAKERKSQCTN